MSQAFYFATILYFFIYFFIFFICLPDI